MVSYIPSYQLRHIQCKTSHYTLSSHIPNSTLPGTPSSTLCAKQAGFLYPNPS